MRLAVISDPHSNLVALETLSDLLHSCNRVVCLGDLTGYYTQPNEVISALRDLSAICVLGNHDYFALHGCPSHLPAAVQWGVAYTAEHLTADHRAWLADLPLTWGGFIGDISALFVHGAPWNPLHAYLYANEPRLAELDHYDFDLIAFGQTHRALLRRDSRPLILNPGAVGQSRDVLARACAAIIDTERLGVEMISRPYDPGPVIALARRAGADDWITKHLT